MTIEERTAWLKSTVENIEGGILDQLHGDYYQSFDADEARPIITKHVASLIADLESQFGAADALLGTVADFATHVLRECNGRNVLAGIAAEARDVLARIEAARGAIQKRTQSQDGEAAP